MSSGSTSAIPMLAVRRGRPGAEVRGSARTARRRAASSRPPLPRGLGSVTATNSSPPRRADDVGVAARRRQARPQLHQHLVAHGVAVGVVDGLEVVEVDEQHRGLVAVGPRPLDGHPEVLLQEGPVRQAGQVVVGGLVGQLPLPHLHAGLDLLGGGDVEDLRHEVRDLPVVVAHGRDPQVDPDLPAGRGGGSASRGGRCRARPRRTWSTSSWSASRSSGWVISAKVRPDEVVGGVARDGRPGGVHVQEDPVRRHQGDPRRRVVERGPEGLLGPDPGGQRPPPRR